MSDTERGKRLPDIAEMLETAYSITDDSEQSYQLLSYLDDVFSQSNWVAGDELMNKTDVDRVSPAGLVVILNMVYHARLHLKDREAFIKRAEESLIRRIGPERTENLLKNRR